MEEIKLSRYVQQIQWLKINSKFWNNKDSNSPWINDEEQKIEKGIIWTIET